MSSLHNEESQSHQSFINPNAVPCILKPKSFKQSMNVMSILDATVWRLLQYPELSVCNSSQHGSPDFSTQYYKHPSMQVMEWRRKLGGILKSLRNSGRKDRTISSSWILKPLPVNILAFKTQNSFKSKQSLKECKYFYLLILKNILTLLFSPKNCHFH